MDFWDITRVMFRRWYVAVPMLLASVVATGYTASAVKPDYSLTAYVQLIPPVASGDTQANTQRNPWLLLGLEALTQAADYATLDQTFLNDLTAQGDSINFSIVVGTPVGGATIEVIGHTLEQTEATTDAILQHFEGAVQDLQGQYNVKQTDMITTHRLDRGENLKRPGGKVKRAVIVVAGVGLLLTCGLTIAVDAAMRRRRRRRTGPAGSAGVAAPVPGYPPLSHNGSASLVRGSENAEMTAAANAREPVRERRSAPTTPAGAEVAPPREHAADQTAMLDKLPLSSDATIVLSVPRDEWNGDKGGGKRR